MLYTFMVVDSNQSTMNAVARDLFSGKPRGPCVGFSPYLHQGGQWNHPGFGETLPRLAMRYVVCFYRLLLYYLESNPR